MRFFPSKNLNSISSVLNFEGHKMARVLNSFEDLGKSVYNLYQNGVP